MNEGDESYNFKQYTYATYRKAKEYGHAAIIKVGRGIKFSWNWVLGDPNRLTALSTFAIFLATAVAVGVGIAQWCALRSTDEKIGRQLTLAENDQRPWIRPKLVRFSDMTITDDKLSFDVDIQFENIGKTPAFNVRGYQKIFNGDGNLLPQHDALCHQIESGAAAYKDPVVVFPNEATPEVLNPLEGKVIDLQLGLHPNQAENTPRVLYPEILGCVVYKSATGSEYHHTWYSWSIVRQDLTGNIRRIESIAQTIPGREIGRGWMNSGRNYADQVNQEQYQRTALSEAGIELSTSVKSGYIALIRTVPRLDLGSDGHLGNDAVRVEILEHQLIRHDQDRIEWRGGALVTAQAWSADQLELQRLLLVGPRCLHPVPDGDRKLAPPPIGQYRIHHEAIAGADREGDGDRKVSNDIERELAKILARDNELRDAEASEKRKQEAAIAAAVIEWESRVEKVLLPAIEPLVAMLKGAGWTCDIERTPHGFKVAAFRGNMVVYGSRERPSLSFELQKGKDLVTLHEATPSGVRLDSRILGVSVEPDVVKNRIVEFVSKLALK